MTTMISVVAEDDGCRAGDAEACAELDRRRLEPPLLELDDVCGNCGGEGYVRPSAAFPQVVECGACHGGVI